MEIIIQDKTYHLHYSVSRIEKMEQVCDCSVATVIAKTSSGEMPKLSVLTRFFAYGLIDESGAYAPIKLALEAAEAQLSKSGYVEMMNVVIEQLMEDCGFLFQGA